MESFESLNQEERKYPKLVEELSQLIADGVMVRFNRCGEVILSPTDEYRIKTLKRAGVSNEDILQAIRSKTSGIDAQLKKEFGQSLKRIGKVKMNSYAQEKLNCSVEEFNKVDTREFNKRSIMTALDKSDDNCFRDGLLLLSYTPCGVCCSTYVSRIYSVDGTDKRFPKLPDIFLTNYELHKDCKCMLINTIFYDDPEIDHIFYQGKEHLNVIEVSNRPFVEDDRSPEMVEHDNMLKAERIRLKIAKENKELYHKLSSICPEVTPKSLGAFSRMRNSNSKKYREIQAYASEHGLEI